MVKQYSGNDEYFGQDDTRFEDSDYEDGPEKSGNSVSEVGISSSDGQPDQGTLPILVIGSYVRQV